MSLFSFLGLDTNQNSSIEEYQKKGALILDVRTSNEYASGHIKGSKNIPLNELSNAIKELETLQKPIITCCQSGMRSGQATSLLQKNKIDAINGGGWQNLNQKLK